MKLQDRVIKVRAQEELDEAHGDHRAAFCNVLDLRGTDKRTAQFKFFDHVANYMIREWKEYLG